MKKTDPPIIEEEVLKASIQQVWNALTRHEEMVQWYFDNIPAFQAEVGFTTQFVIENEGRTFTHLWEVTEVVPLRRISYNWKYTEYDGDSFITFELIQLQEGVMVRAIMTVLADYPDDIPEFDPESGRQGWHYFLGLRLKEYLETES